MDADPSAALPSVFSSMCPHCGLPLDDTDAEPLTKAACPACGGEVVLGEMLERYRLVGVAGRGGMGVVYKAVDTSLDRHVALKVLRKDHSENEGLILQLETEAAITASIGHPNVVRVYTTGYDRGRFFIAMELVEKGTLDDLIRIQGNLAELQALNVGLDAAQGLRAAHQHGLIHRDIKPGNILFDDNRTGKIVDFGLAMLEAQSQGSAEIWGTPYYVSPERLDQQPEDFRSDMYSLGATLFHALAGRPPFEAADATLVALKHLKNQAVSLQAFAPRVSNSTAYVINRLLHKDPAERYASYDELIEHLEYAREQLLAKASQPAPQQRVVLEDEGQQKLWGMITVGMIVIAIGVAGWFFLNSGSKKKGPASATAAAVESVSETGALGIASGTPEAGKFDTARAKLLGRDVELAARDFSALASSSRTSEPIAQWSAVHEGLAQLLAGRNGAAAAAFQRLEQRRFSGSGETASLGAIFSEIATLGAAEPPPRDLSGELGDSAHAPLGLFILGLRNWNAGAIDEGGALLRRFDSAAARSSATWLSDLKPLASDYLAAFSEYRTVADAITKSGSAEQANRAFEKFAAGASSLKDGARLVERLIAVKQERGSRTGSSGSSGSSDSAPSRPSYSSSTTSSSSSTTTGATDVDSVPAPPEFSVDATQLKVPAPADWKSTNIGYDPSWPQGKTELDLTTGELVMDSAGEDVWKQSDSFRFYHMPAQGDVDVMLRVDSIKALDEYTKCGVMVREGLTRNARFVAVSYRAGSSFGHQARSKMGEMSTGLREIAPSGMPCWIRLVKTSGRVTTLISTDLTQWRILGPVINVRDYNDPQVGIFLTSHVRGVTASFKGRLVMKK